MKLAEAMRLKNVTQAEVARAFAVKPPTVSSDWLKHGRISKRHYQKLVEYFGLSFDWWFGADAHPATTSTELCATSPALPDTANAQLEQLIQIYSNLSEGGKHKLLQEAVWMLSIENPARGHSNN